MNKTPNRNMNRNANNDIIVGLDIGTTKIIALVAKKGETPESLQILGIGIAESDGLNRGVVVNIDRTVRSIKKVISQAEHQAGVKIDEVIVGIAGDHIESFKARGIIAISSPTNEISKDDVQRLLDDTKKVSIPSEREIIHVIPQDFIIDDQDGVADPVGMSGVRMEANVHVVTGLKTAITNLQRCVERAGMKVKDVVLEPIASSNSVLSNDEKEVGVALIDIGGGTTDIAIFEENIIRYTSVIGIAGRQVTDDIRKGLGIIHSEAERIKREHGFAFLDSILKDDVIMIPGVGGRNPIEINRSTLCSIIQPRMEEILEFAMKEIVKSGYADSLGAGIVLTGGTTLLNGTDALASHIFEKPIKIGIPGGVSYNGLGPEVGSPIFSTAVGLAMYGIKEESEYAIANENSGLSENSDINSTTAEEKPNKDVSKQDEENKSKEKKEPKKSIFEKAKEYIGQL